MSKCATCHDSSARYTNMREEGRHDFSSGFAEGTINDCPTCGRHYYSHMHYNGFAQRRIPTVIAAVMKVGFLKRHRHV